MGGEIREILEVLVVVRQIGGGSGVVCEVVGGLRMIVVASICIILTAGFLRQCGGLEGSESALGKSSRNEDGTRCLENRGNCGRLGG